VAPVADVFASGHRPTERAERAAGGGRGGGRRAANVPLNHLHEGYTYATARPAPASCHGVSTRGPSAVTAMVNSKCAASDPSWEKIDQ
jgi:hypothetical protein